MQKAIWLNLLKHSKMFVPASHEHVQLLETFFSGEEIQTRSLDTPIDFNEFAQFAEKKGVSKETLFSGLARRLFRTLDEELPHQTLAVAVADHTIIYHFQDKQCTDIYNIEIDFDSYTFVKELGKGSNGTARLYQNKSGLAIVLKTPNAAIPRPVYYASRKRDIEMAQALYPDDGFYCVNKHFRQVLNDKGKLVPAFDFYVVLPYLEGENFYTFCRKLTTKTELIEAFLAVTAELMRMHAYNIMHGDIKFNNILLWRDPETQKIQVRFLDFEWAYYRHEKATITTTPTPYWAPERVYLPAEEFADESFEILPPNSDPAQDIFSYGYTLWEILHKHPLLTALPSVRHFYRGCLHPDAQRRPIPETLVEILKQEAKQEAAVAATKSTTASLMLQGIAGQLRTVSTEYFAKPKKAAKSEQVQAELDAVEKTYSLVRKSNNFAHGSGMKPNDGSHATGPKLQTDFKPPTHLILDDFFDKSGKRIQTTGLLTAAETTLKPAF